MKNSATDAHRRGLREAEELLNVQDRVSILQIPGPNYITNASGQIPCSSSVNYIVRDEDAVIVPDEIHWSGNALVAVGSDGPHQAIEAKENLAIPTGTAAPFLPKKPSPIRISPALNPRPGLA